MIIALAVTRDGMPVRSWVLPGDTADVTTVQQIKDDLRQMRLGRALFVGDAGLYAKANLAELGRGAGRYILATPIELRIPKQAGHLFRIDVGHRSDLIPARVPR